MINAPNGIEAAAGLRESDRATVSDLVNVWRDRLPRNRLRESYYTMHATLKDLEISIPPSLTDINAAIGWPAKAVDVLADRSRFDGFTCADEEAEEELAAIVQANGLRRKYRKAVTSELKSGCAALVVTASDGGPRITAYPATAFSALYDDTTDSVSAVMVVVSVEHRNGKPTNKPDWVDVYTASDLIRLKADDGGYWVAEYVPHGLGRVPAEILAYQSTLERPFGQSRITREVMALTDSAIRASVRGEVSAEFAAAPQKYLLGTDKDPFSGKTKWDAYIGNIFNIDVNRDGQTPTFGQLPQASMQPHTDYMRYLIGRMSACTNIPVSELGQFSDVANSAEAIKAQLEPLILKAECLNDDNGECLVNVARMAIATARGAGFESVAGVEIDARFRNPAMPSVAATTDAAIKLASASQGFAQTPTFWELVGFNEEERKRIDRELREVQGVNLLSAIAGGSE